MLRASPDKCKLATVSTYTSNTLFIIGVAAAHSASALASNARPIAPINPSLGFSLRNALEIIQPPMWTVGLPPAAKSFSSNGDSKLNGSALPRLMQRDIGDLRCSEETQVEGLGSASISLLSWELGPDSGVNTSPEGSPPVARMFPSLSETTTGRISGNHLPKTRAVFF